MRMISSVLPGSGYIFAFVGISRDHEFGLDTILEYGSKILGIFGIITFKILYNYPASHPVTFATYGKACVLIGLERHGWVYIV